MDFFVITVIKSFWHAEHNAGAAVIEENTDAEIIDEEREIR